MSRAKNGSDENAGACAHERIYDVRIREMKAIATYGYAHGYEHTYSSVVRVCVGGGACVRRAHICRAPDRGRRAVRAVGSAVALLQQMGPNWPGDCTPAQSKCHARTRVSLCVCVCVLVRADESRHACKHPRNPMSVTANMHTYMMMKAGVQSHTP